MRLERMKGRRGFVSVAHYGTETVKLVTDTNPDKPPFIIKIHEDENGDFIINSPDFSLIINPQASNQIVLKPIR